MIKWCDGVVEIEGCLDIVNEVGEFGVICNLEAECIVAPFSRCCWMITPSKTRWIEVNGFVISWGEVDCTAVVRGGVVGQYSVNEIGGGLSHKWTP